MYLVHPSMHTDVYSHHTKVSIETARCISDLHILSLAGMKRSRVGMYLVHPSMHTLCSMPNPQPPQAKVKLADCCY